MALTTDWGKLRSDYACVSADCPWPYETRDAIYEFMSMEQLKALPVARRVAPNAHLYLWTTNAFMVEAHDLARAWGFKPKTIITWTKVKEDGSPSMKTGYYFRGATEHCVFAVRGSLRLAGDRGESTALFSRRLPHSVKPPEFYSLVERCSPGPRLEMFARIPRVGWDCFGDGVSAERTGQIDDFSDLV